mgnify:FL=1
MYICNEKKKKNMDIEIFNLRFVDGVKKCYLAYDIEGVENETHYLAKVTSKYGGVYLLCPKEGASNKCC